MAQQSQYLHDLIILETASLIENISSDGTGLGSKQDHGSHT